MAGKNKRSSITTAQLAQYETLLPLIESIHNDIQELSRKNQTAVLSKSRIALINRLLTDAKRLLEGEPTAPYLELLDEAAVPQNADALLTLGQFKAALDQFEEKYTYYDEEEHTTCWSLVG